VPWAVTYMLDSMTHQDRGEPLAVVRPSHGPLVLAAVLAGIVFLWAIYRTSRTFWLFSLGVPVVAGLLVSIPVVGAWRRSAAWLAIYPDCVVVRNRKETHQVARADIARVETNGQMWLVLRDGDRVPVDAARGKLSGERIRPQVDLLIAIVMGETEPQHMVLNFGGYRRVINTMTLSLFAMWVLWGLVILAFLILLDISMSNTNF